MRDASDKLLTELVDEDYIEPEFPKSNTARRVRITYSICGEVEFNDMGDEYVEFRDKEGQDRHDKAHFISWFKNRAVSYTHLTLPTRDLV